MRRCKTFVSAIGDEGAALYLGAQYWLDMVFPPLLGAVIFLFFRWLFPGLPGLVIGIVSLTYVVADILENSGSSRDIARRRRWPDTRDGGHGKSVDDGEVGPRAHRCRDVGHRHRPSPSPTLVSRCVASNARTSRCLCHAEPLSEVTNERS